MTAHEALAKALKPWFGADFLDEVAEAGLSALAIGGFLAVAPTGSADLVARWRGLADGYDEDDEAYRQCADELEATLARTGAADARHNHDAIGLYAGCLACGTEAKR